ncbi:MAG TPA: class I SAM-dependent methyltransferase [Nitrospirota bacterium]
MEDLPERFPRNTREAMVRLCPFGERVLEIGFGDGKVLYNLRGKFKNLFGVEISAQRCSKTLAALKEKNIPAECFVQSIEDGLNFPAGFFDVIIWSDVIEHVMNVWKAMEEVSRLLAKGGTLITATPNMAFIVRRLRLMMGRFPSTCVKDEGLRITREGELFDGGHLHYFTFGSIERLYWKYGIRPQLRVGFGRFGRLHNLHPSLLSGVACVVGQKL